MEQLDLPETQLLNALCTLMHYSRQVNLQKRGSKILYQTSRHRLLFFNHSSSSVFGLIDSDSRRQSIKKKKKILRAFLLIFTWMSRGQSHLKISNGTPCLSTKHGLPAELRGFIGGERQRTFYGPVPLWAETLSTSRRDLRGLDTLCALAGAWAAFVFPIKRLKQWIIAVGYCGCVQHRHHVSRCVCVCAHVILQ